VVFELSAQSVERQEEPSLQYRVQDVHGQYAGEDSQDSARGAGRKTEVQLAVHGRVR